jgi:hypothetical protein
MQIPGSDGQAVSVADIRRVVVAAKMSKSVLPRERRPASTIVSTMIVLPQERRPTSSITSAMTV